MTTAVENGLGPAPGALGSVGGSDGPGASPVRTERTLGTGILPVTGPGISVTLLLVVASAAIAVGLAVAAATRRRRPRPAERDVLLPDLSGRIGELRPAFAPA